MVDKIILPKKSILIFFFKQRNVRARVQSQLYLISCSISCVAMLNGAITIVTGPPGMGAVLPDTMGRDPKPSLHVLRKDCQISLLFETLL